MLAGNQVIVTQYGGVTEHLSNESAHIIEHKMGPVANMSWSVLYGSYQSWAYPSIRSLSSHMRKVYTDPSRYADKAIKAREIAETMTTQAISNIIDKELGGAKKIR